MGYTDSTITSTTLPITGVWVHDPADPMGTILHYEYGANMRSTAVDQRGEGSWYAGRTSPVMDFAEGTGRAFTVSIQVPHGGDWFTRLVSLRTIAQGKRTLYLRDNRGRMAYGTVSGYREDDEGWGTTVAFTFTEVSYDVTVVA